MGNSASQLPYSIDNQVGAPHDHNGWALHNGKSTDGNETPVTVFVGKKPLLSKQPVSPRFPNKTQLVPALHHYNQCRKLRHPQILKVLATLDTDNPTAAANDTGGPSSPTVDSSSKAITGDLIIVTEPCVSLDQWFLSNPTHEQIAWGLECVVQALHFLHSSANLAHGNLSPSSFYVTRSGDVKLWNFSLLTPVGPDVGPSNHFKEWEQAVTPESYRSPERVQLNYAAISQAGVHAMDSFSLGVLIDHWFQGQIPAMLQKAVQRLETPNLKMRPRLQPLLKCPIFDTPLQKLQKQFEEITIQPIDQKVALWQNLGLSMQAGLIPQELALYKVLPLIQSSIQTTCTNESLMGQDLYRREVLATIAPMFYIVENYLEPGKVSKLLGPIVSLLFTVKDRGVRGALLNKVNFMCQHLEKNTLNTSVFEPLCSGFNDSSPALRELTLKTTLDLVPYLSAPNMEKLSRYLVRLQSDPETSIRTNAVIFIAKIAPSLSEISREKMLLPAYARAMKDAFPPCRLSALQSVSKSQELFSKPDLAAKVLPAVTPLLLDPMPNVRKEAFQAVHTFLRVLEQESDRLAHLAQRQAAENAKAANATSTGANPTPTGVAPVAAAPAVNTAPAPAPSSGRYLSGISSWMSSSAKPDTATPVSTTASNVSGSPNNAGPPPAVPAPSMLTTTTSQLSAINLAPPPSINDDGWGDDDADDGGWGDVDGGGDGSDDDIEEDPFANIGSKKSVNTTATPMSVAPTPVPARAPPTFDDEDDPFAAIGMKTTTFGKTAAAAPKGKLILPKKSVPLKLNKPTVTPATKLKLDSSEMGDGWDEF